MKIPELIYSSGNNRRYVEIAEKYGISIGCRLPATCYAKVLRFADLDFKNPNRNRYLESLCKWRPHKAVMPDIFEIDDIDETLSWSEEAARYVQEIIIVPKASGVISRLPHQIGGTEVILGYPMPSSYSMKIGAPLWEFEGRRIHLLGGSIKKQMEFAVSISNVVSVDGNYSSLIAEYGRFFRDGRENQIGDGRKGFPYRCFEMTCKTLFEEWQNTLEYHRSSSQLTFKHIAAQH